jgi:hypothetical protein
VPRNSQIRERGWWKCRSGGSDLGSFRSSRERPREKTGCEGGTDEAASFSSTRFTSLGRQLARSPNRSSSRCAAPARPSNSGGSAQPDSANQKAASDALEPASSGEEAGREERRESASEEREGEGCDRCRCASCRMVGPGGGGGGGGEGGPGGGAVGVVGEDDGVLDDGGLEGVGEGEVTSCSGFRATQQQGGEGLGEGLGAAGGGGGEAEQHGQEREREEHRVAPQRCGDSSVALGAQGAKEIELVGWGVGRSEKKVSGRQGRGGGKGVGG